jgi:hypothetical protein
VHFGWRWEVMGLLVVHVPLLESHYQTVGVVGCVDARAHGNLNSKSGLPLPLQLQLNLN